MGGKEREVRQFTGIAFEVVNLLHLAGDQRADVLVLAKADGDPARDVAVVDAVVRGDQVAVGTELLAHVFEEDDSRRFDSRGVREDFCEIAAVRFPGDFDAGGFEKRLDEIGAGDG